VPREDGTPGSDKRLFLRRVGVCSLGIVLGGLVGAVIGAEIGEATEPPKAPGDPLQLFRLARARISRALAVHGSVASQMRRIGQACG
jgi:hypothetical protein